MELAGLLNYLVGFFIMVGIYGIFSLGLNLQWGFTGLFNAGIAGFFALGAYTSALLTTPAPDSNLVEDFVFGGNLAGIPYLDWGIDVWFIVSLAAVALVCGSRCLPGGTAHAAAQWRLSGYRDTGHCRSGAVDVSQREVDCQRIKGLVPDTGVSGRPGFSQKLRLPIPRCGGGGFDSALSGCTAGR